MADLTFKGTTQLALTQIGVGGKIDANTKVTLTDNLYTIADLAAIIAVATANKIKLEKTAASVAFENDYATINPVLARVEKYTGPVTLTDASGVSAADLNTIAKATTGKVTATLNPAATIDDDTV